MSYKKSVFRSLAMVTQLGISVITPIFLCIFAGYQIDSRFGTRWTILFLILGVLAGGRAAWIMVQNTLRAEQREDEQIKAALRKDKEHVDYSKPKVPSRIRNDQAETKKEMDEDGMA